jgi:hypothetical protein
MKHYYNHLIDRGMADQGLSHMPGKLLLVNEASVSRPQHTQQYCNITVYIYNWNQE